MLLRKSPWRFNFPMLLLLLLFASCQKENMEINTLQQMDLPEEFIDVKKLNINEVVREVPIVEHYRQRTNGSQSRPNGLNDFEIVSDVVTYVSDGISEYYTFQINRMGSPLTENLIIVSHGGLLKSGKEYTSYVTTYDISPEQKQALEEGGTISWAETVSMYPIELDDAGALIAKREEAKCYEIREVTEKSRATGWDIIVLKLVEVQCPGPPGGVAGHDSHPGNNNGDGTGTTGGGGGAVPPGGIYTAPNMDGYDWELKNFESGVLDAALRKYYKSDINIQNTVNTFLKQNSFSEFSQAEAKVALVFGKNFGLNFSQFYWAFNNMHSQKMQDIEQYLTNVIMDEQTSGFIKAAIDAWKQDGEVDIVEEIINELTGKEKCLHDLLTKNGTNFVKDLLKKFEGESEFDIKIMSKDKVVYTDKDGKKKEVNGKTIYELNSKFINIEISTTKLNVLPALGAVRTILHEYIHADMFRKLYTLSPTQKDLDFKTTYENFKSERGHEVMALLYVNSMKEALKEFHKKVLMDDYNFLTDNGANPLPDSFYEGLAWQGLKEHGVQSYKDLKDDKKTEMENSINLYYHSTTKSCPKK